jgi:hypothetical protein
MSTFLEVADASEYIRRRNKSTAGFRTKSKVGRRVEDLSGPTGDELDAETPTKDVWLPQGSLGYTNNIIGGIVSGLKLALGMIVFANVTFNSSNNQSVQGLFATGINLNFLGASVA